jgi:Zn-dependent protease
VSSITSEFSRHCRKCGQELAIAALACAHCHALVHAEALERLSAQAKEMEAKDEIHAAREQWMACLPLLPQTSRQAHWVRDHVHDLSLRADRAGALQVEPSKNEISWNKKLTPLVTLVLFIAVYSAIDGVRFGGGFALLILIHEMGHFVDIKRRGLPADMPVFLPGLGAYVRWRAIGVSMQTRAAVSLAGPLAGWMGSAACALIWWKTGDGLWAALARTNAWLNVLNLAPVWILDGGQAIHALSRIDRVVLLIASVALLVVVREPAFILVALVAGIRIFTRDSAERSNPAIAAYFVAVLALLGLVMKIVPSQGTGM